MSHRIKVDADQIADAIGAQGHDLADNTRVTEVEQAATSGREKLKEDIQAQRDHLSEMIQETADRLAEEYQAGDEKLGNELKDMADAMSGQLAKLEVNLADPAKAVVSSAAEADSEAPNVGDRVCVSAGLPEGEPFKAAEGEALDRVADGTGAIAGNWEIVTDLSGESIGRPGTTMYVEKLGELVVRSAISGGWATIGQFAEDSVAAKSELDGVEKQLQKIFADGMTELGQSLANAVAEAAQERGAMTTQFEESQQQQSEEFNARADQIEQDASTALANYTQTQSVVDAGQDNKIGANKYDIAGLGKELDDAKYDLGGKLATEKAEREQADFDIESRVTQAYEGADITINARIDAANSQFTYVTKALEQQDLTDSEASKARDLALEAKIASSNADQDEAFAEQLAAVVEESTAADAALQGEIENTKQSVSDEAGFRVEGDRANSDELKDFEEYTREMFMRVVEYTNTQAKRIHDRIYKWDSSIPSSGSHAIDFAQNGNIPNVYIAALDGNLEITLPSLGFVEADGFLDVFRHAEPVSKLLSESGSMTVSGGLDYGEGETWSSETDFDSVDTSQRESLEGIRLQFKVGKMNDHSVTFKGGTIDGEDSMTVSLDHASFELFCTTDGGGNPVWKVR